MEADIKRIITEGKPEQKVHKTTSQPIKMGHGGTCLLSHLHQVTALGINARPYLKKRKLKSKTDGGMAQVVELMHRDLFSHVNHDNHKFICAQKSSFTMKFHNHFKTKQSSLKLCYKIKMFLYLEIFYLIFKLLNETPRYHKCKHVTKI
jgi:hypothetical protein